MDGGVTWAIQASGTASGLRAVSFADALTGAIVGDDGTILGTTDGGSTWVSRWSWTAHDLRAVFLMDAQTGVAVGTGGTVLRTTDGGNTWESQASWTTKTLSDVFFADSLTGMVVVENDALARTDDGGITWVRQHSAGNLTAVCMVDRLTAFAVGYLGYFVVTTDGGASWWRNDAISIEGLFHDLAFADVMTGWIVGEHIDTFCEPGPCLPNWEAVWKIMNGGWEYRYLPTSSVEGTQKYYGIHALDSLTATVVGSSGTVIRTEDGGGHVGETVAGRDDPNIESGLFC